MWSSLRFVALDNEFEGFRLDNDILAICPNAAATPLLSFYKYNRFTKNCQEKIRLIFS